MKEQTFSSLSCYPIQIMTLTCDDEKEVTGTELEPGFILGRGICPLLKIFTP